MRCPRCDTELPPTGTACPGCGMARTLRGLMEWGATPEGRAQAKRLGVRMAPDLGVPKALLALALNALVFPGLGSLLARLPSCVAEMLGFGVGVGLILWSGGLDLLAGAPLSSVSIWTYWGLLAAFVAWSGAVKDGVRLVRRATGHAPPPWRPGGLGPAAP